ncbi:MAG: hypothetical protein HOP15_11185 [Planctomycetes bacterium]|nr:hypothetical protein [Planctomycetota bacterium]
MLRSQSGDREAMNQLFLTVQDPLYRFLRALGADAHSAKDLLQEVFVTIYAKIRWLREPALFRAWSYRIVHRLARGVWRASCASTIASRPMWRSRP